MKNYLTTLFLVYSLGLTACSDKSNTQSDRVNTQAINSKLADTGPGKDYKPVVNVNNSINLYKVTTHRDKNNCKTFTYIADQLSGENCEKLKELNIQKDEEPQNGKGPTRIIESGPHKGKLAWSYHCVTEVNFKAWYKSATICE